MITVAGMPSHTAISAAGRAGARENQCGCPPPASNPTVPPRLLPPSGAQPGAQSEEDERCVLDAQQEADAGGRVGRVRRAGSGREAERTQQRAGGTDQLDPGDGDDLWRDEEG